MVQIVHIVGPQGCGKSTLCLQIVQQLAGQGLRTVVLEEEQHHHFHRCSAEHVRAMHAGQDAVLIEHSSPDTIAPDSQRSDLRIPAGPTHYDSVALVPHAVQMILQRMGRVPA
ncbi:molybdopterin-guanine dinucleotide biosynthesis protein MobB [Xylophilus sp. Leaf220]|uniref:molybdopterin-guanine dinucleotide biosynthesis protein MobB n=1 Tax=Xylophilus sp. Leaf220 TaxID=1735686 RepID=UPI0006F544DC|nr:molybdopterin-guanine dinucleotide biosynthesis protein MobB [Xylophilus sp. Leaf220]KQM68797.1 hypothetical protein ASE76_13955 [Xylophilus sp. Leaf220]